MFPKPLKKAQNTTLSTMVPTLETLATEIKAQIFNFLPQGTLHSLLSVSSALSKVAVVQLYQRPKFISTYRFAQFVTTVSHSKTLAHKVRIFILSHDCLQDIGHSLLAGWREWKYRTQPYYSATDAALTVSTLHEMRKYVTYAKHPVSNPNVGQDCCDVPTGAIMHVLAVCKNLRKVTLSVNNIVGDWIIASSVYPPTTSSGLIFASDVPRSWTHKSRDVKFVRPNAIVESLIALPRLQHLAVNKASWLSEFNARELVTGCRELIITDFRGSGIEGPAWAIKGTNHEVVLALVSMPN